MKKIPSLFKRDFAGNPRLVTREYNDGVEWVIKGEGTATRKWDGTACLILGSGFYKRFDAKHGKTPPAGFVPAQEPDTVTGHWPGWIRVDPSAKENCWLMRAYNNSFLEIFGSGTFEAIGPKINSNRERQVTHSLQAHGNCTIPEIKGIGPELTVLQSRSYDDLKDYLFKTEIEGIVFHHLDGRMAKIKRSDFGFDWPVKM